MSIGARLKELRVRKNKSLQEVADGVGASKAHVWEIERGGSKNPSMELLIKLAEYFDVTVSYLVDEDLPRDAGEQEELMVLYRDLKRLDDKDRAAIRTLMKRFKEMKEGG